MKNKNYTRTPKGIEYNIDVGLNIIVAPQI